MQKNQILPWLLVIIWMGVIFMFSDQEGVESSDLSNSVVDIIADFLNSLHINITDISFMSYAVRKLAHMFIYFVLAILIMNAFRFSNFKTVSNVLFTLLICFLYACTDEFHQSFTPGRNMAFGDVMFDTTGALFGIMTFFITTLMLQRFFSSRQ